LASHMESLILGSECWKFGSLDMEWSIHMKPIYYITYICRTCWGNVILYAALCTFVLLWVLWSSICHNLNCIFPGATRLYPRATKFLTDNRDADLMLIVNY
jgi:hypothetical protein